VPLAVIPVYEEQEKVEEEFSGREVRGVEG
jgi:hypothetical protein